MRCTSESESHVDQERAVRLANGKRPSAVNGSEIRRITIPVAADRENGQQFVGPVEMRVSHNVENNDATVGTSGR